MTRAEVVRRNASNRMKGLNHLILPLPPKPERVFGWELYQRGTYMGFTKDQNEVTEYLASHPLATAKKAESLNG